tara:strand:- start:44 stop:385 length:342 start_codon:yes stop_codon:yes gene_type:complete
MKVYNIKHEDSSLLSDYFYGTVKEARAVAYDNNFPVGSYIEEKHLDGNALHKTLLNLLNRDSTRYYPFLAEDVKAEHKITPVYIKKVNKLPLPKLKPNKYFDSQFGRGRRSPE